MATDNTTMKTWGVNEFGGCAYPSSLCACHFIVLSGLDMGWMSLMIFGFYALAAVLNE